ncbi:2-hydroxyacid dehydrogenase [Rheinheimera salexigens]|uniref:Hydroxyacid dehydrogenase n=1 Tax=Rheinheimera salexigens TaxID=1628148 RepID=A0A1E7Q305_9GAMM|nr:2-hydroxyacid dehydrogenase [Rheinheimera salexigens]OEY68545.1 hydroxyacid dehydrogenase [Rheinheimera salexigens]
MKVAVFSTQSYDRTAFTEANQSFTHQLIFLQQPLNSQTASLAKGCQAVCVFVNDKLDKACLEQLAAMGIHTIALRCAGYNNVCLVSAQALAIKVVYVPDYAPEGIAEHAVGLILALNRQLHRAYNRVRDNNFMLSGMLGFNLHGKTVGVVGTGKIGEAFCRIMQGFGCSVIAYDPEPNPNCQQMGVEYMDFQRLISCADIISLHCPLTAKTRYLIDDKALSIMKPGVMLINTSRGAVLDTQAAIKHLKNGKIGYLGLDVYEHEAALFFSDRSAQILQDDMFSRLLTMPNVLITGHQAFFTAEAITTIANTTLANITAIQQGANCINEVTAP